MVVAVGAAALAQAVGGFGFAVLVVPTLSLVIEPIDAIAITLPLMLASGAWVAWKERSHIVWPSVRLLMVGAVFGLPVGLYASSVASGDQLRLAVAAATLAALVLLWSGFTVSTEARALDVGAGFMSGLLGTAISASGPPTVFALQARNLPPTRFRPTVAAVLSLISLAGTVMFFADARFGTHARTGVIVGLPALIAGTIAGQAVRDRIPADAFRRGVLIFLAFAATLTAASAV